jgi:DNA-directed RNA polymerase specialized sigma24 family protein
VVQEIAENCLIKVRERRWHYKPRNFEMFMHKLVWNHLRKRRGRRAVRKEYDLEHLLAITHRPPDWSLADRSLSEESITSACREILMTLRYRPRAAYELVRLDGLSHADAAEHLGVSPETIKNYVSEVTKILRKEFETRGIIDSSTPAACKSHRKWKKNEAALVPDYVTPRSATEETCFTA